MAARVVCYDGMLSFLEGFVRGGRADRVDAWPEI